MPLLQQVPRGPEMLLYALMSETLRKTDAVVSAHINCILLYVP